MRLDLEFSGAIGAMSKFGGSKIKLALVPETQLTSHIVRENEGILQNYS